MHLSVCMPFSISRQPYQLGAPLPEMIHHLSYLIEVQYLLASPTGATDCSLGWSEAKSQVTCPPQCSSPGKGETRMPSLAHQAALSLETFLTRRLSISTNSEKPMAK